MAADETFSRLMARLRSGEDGVDPTVTLVANSAEATRTSGDSFAGGPI